MGLQRTICTVCGAHSIEVPSGSLCPVCTRGVMVPIAAPGQADGDDAGDPPAPAGLG